MIAISRSLTAVNLRIHSTINESSLFSNEIAEWLQKERELSDGDEQVTGQFNGIELLIKKLTWQIPNTVRMFHSYNDTNTSSDVMMPEHIEPSIKSIQDIFDRLS
jgi:hypothetical protein